MKALPILAFAAVMILLTPGVLGATYQSCSGNNTLLMIREVTIDVVGSGTPNFTVNRTRTFNVTESETCGWGCQNNECLQPPWIAYATVLGVIILMVVVYLFLRPR